LLEARDAEGVGAVAQIREQLIERIAAAARKRAAAQKRIGTVQTGSTAEEAELVELYQHLRHRHEVRARVIRRHGDRNARAVGVLAQAANQSSLYGADGRMAGPWTGT
jgi:flagellar biosynthesis/type III secretory pathway chaperone